MIKSNDVNCILKRAALKTEIARLRLEIDGVMEILNSHKMY